MKHDYTALDGAILEVLKSGAKTFRNIESYPKAKEEANKLAQAHNRHLAQEHNRRLESWERKDSWRFIDTRLQALRKKAQIVFIDQARGWALKEAA